MLKKRYLKSKPKCKVTFKLTKEYIGEVDKVNLVGDMNNWNESDTELKKLKDGSFKLNLNLDTDQEYNFRYKVNDDYWINDDDADEYSPTPYPGVDNSVVAI